MIKIRVNPKTTRMWADTGEQIIAFDGTPLQRQSAVDSWHVVATVKSVLDWQSEPGLYQTYNAVALVSVDENHFYMGGSILRIKNYQQDRTQDGQSCMVVWVDAYDDINVARAVADNLNND